MKTAITIQPLTPTQETLTYEQAKARPGIYRAENYNQGFRFLFLEDDQGVLFYDQNDSVLCVMFDYTSWKKARFIPVQEEITIKFS